MVLNVTFEAEAATTIFGIVLHARLAGRRLDLNHHSPGNYETLWSSVVSEWQDQLQTFHETIVAKKANTLRQGRPQSLEPLTSFQLPWLQLQSRRVLH